MNSHGSKTGIIAGLIVLYSLPLSLVALADGLTAVLGFQIYHLLVGNLLIGIVEAMIVRKRYSMKINTLIVILGNYISMFSGFIVAGVSTNALGFGDSYSGMTDDVGKYRTALVIGILFSFLVTLLVELPFYKWAAKTSWKTALRIEIIPNILTNLAVLVFYYFIQPGK